MNLRQVDTSSAHIVHRLNKMQAICLPADVPCEYRFDDLWWIGYEARKPVAFCTIRPSTYDPGIWYLSRAGVIPEHQGKGYQVRMIRARVAAAKSNGATSVVTDCTAENAPSANSLIKAGFKVYRPVTRWALPHSIYWRKAC